MIVFIYEELKKRGVSYRALPNTFGAVSRRGICLALTSTARILPPLAAPPLSALPPLAVLSMFSGVPKTDYKKRISF
eukprot:COSAG06_NODE_762_length_12488_cov_36.564614_3_plen_77_part_00